MDLETTQITTTTKLPTLKQGEYDMWRLRIEQYFQVQDYALWDVIENENSFKPAAKTTTNDDGTSTTLIPGPVTTEEKVQNKNDMKKIVSQLAILGENISQEDLNLKFLRSLPFEWNTHVVVWRNKPNLDTMSFDDLYNNFKIVEQEVKGTTRSSSSSSSQNKDFVSSLSSTNEVNSTHEVSTANTQVSPASTQVSTASTQVSTANLSDNIVYAFLASQPNGSQLVYETLRNIRTQKLVQKPVVKSYETLKTQLDDLRIEFNKSEFNLANYKRGLASVEEQLVFYKKNDLVFFEQLVVLKRDISYKDSEISVLKGELEKLKQEKESSELKIENFDNASKSLDKLIGSQIPDKSRKVLRFVSYKVVPPPPTRLFSPPNLDLPNSGIEEFQQPEFEGYGPKTSKSISEDISNKVRESLDAPLVKDLVSDDKLEKKTVFPTIAKMEFGHPPKEDQGYVDSGCSWH
ncbi:hypothetical protein Tco_0917247, partial [Tanacetum coccineum]